MNTIRTLAMQWWNELPNNYKGDSKGGLAHKHGFENRSSWRDLTGREIENIFYNEVIKVWYVKHLGVSNPLGFTIDGIVPKEDVIAAYLEEHSKEEPTFAIEEFPLEEPYPIKLDEKLLDECASEIFEQPLSVNKDFEVDEDDTYFNKTLPSNKQIKMKLEEAINEHLVPSTTITDRGGIMNDYKSIMKRRRIWKEAINTDIAKDYWFSRFENKYRHLLQPKVEDNSWDEVERILYNYDQPIGNKIAMLKAKFTLIKK